MPDENDAPNPTRRRLVIGAVIAAVLVGGAAVYAARPDAVFGPQAEAGELLTDRLDGYGNGVATVKLPWGALKVASEDPLDTIGHTALFSRRHDANYDEIDPPDDGFWLPIRVEKDITFDNVLFRARADATIPATTVSLRSGDRVIPIAMSPGGTGTSGTARRIAEQLAPDVEGYLAVPGGFDRDDLVVRVEFDGVHQDVDLDGGKVAPGRAAPLYRDAAAKVDAPCGAATVPGYRLGFTIEGTCGINRLLTLPYVAGLGWAEPGRAWLVVTAETTPPQQLFRGSSTEPYYPERDGKGERNRLRYGTQEPVASAVFNDVRTSVFTDVENPDQFVFDVAANDNGRTAPFVLTTTFRAYKGNPNVTDEQVTVTATRSIDVS